MAFAADRHWRHAAGAGVWHCCGAARRSHRHARAQCLCAFLRHPAADCPAGNSAGVAPAIRAFQPVPQDHRHGAAAWQPQSALFCLGHYFSAWRAIWTAGLSDRAGRTAQTPTRTGGSGLECRCQQMDRSAHHHPAADDAVDHRRSRSGLRLLRRQFRHPSLLGNSVQLSGSADADLSASCGRRPSCAVQRRRAVGSDRADCNGRHRRAGICLAPPRFPHCFDVAACCTLRAWPLARVGGSRGMAPDCYRAVSAVDRSYVVRSGSGLWCAADICDGNSREFPFRAA